MSRTNHTEDEQVVSALQELFRITSEVEPSQGFEAIRNRLAGYMSRRCGAYLLARNPSCRTGYDSRSGRSHAAAGFTVSRLLQVTYLGVTPACPLLTRSICSLLRKRYAADLPAIQPVESLPELSRHLCKIISEDLESFRESRVLGALNAILFTGSQHRLMRLVEIEEPEVASLRRGLSRRLRKHPTLELRKAALGRIVCRRHDPSARPIAPERVPRLFYDFQDRPSVRVILDTLEDVTSREPGSYVYLAALIRGFLEAVRTMMRNSPEWGLTQRTSGTSDEYAIRRMIGRDGHVWIDRIRERTQGVAEHYLDGLERRSGMAYPRALREDMVRMVVERIRLACEKPIGARTPSNPEEWGVLRNWCTHPDATNLLSRIEHILSELRRHLRHELGPDPEIHP